MMEQSPHLGLPHRLGGLVKGVGRDAAAAFGRTPLEVLLGASLAIGFSIAVETDSIDAWPHLLVSVAIALPLVFSISILHAAGAIGSGRRWGFSAAAVVAAAVHGAYVFDGDLEAEAWRAILLVFAAFATLFAVPGIERRHTDDLRGATRRHGGRLLGRIVIVAAYSAALWIGLAAAIAAVNGLFELQLDGEPYAHLAAATFMLLPPWAVAAGLPELLVGGDRTPRLPAHVNRRIGGLLLAPLIIVYLLIAYSYAVRVILTGEVPKNLISPVVIGAGALIVASTLLLDRVFEDENAVGLQWAVRLAAPLLLPLLFFAAWAVTARLDQYGWTEFRYLRLLVLVWLIGYAAAAAVRLFRRRPPPLTWVPGSIAAIALLSAIGPWSALGIAKASQAGRLETLLAGVDRPSSGDHRTGVPTERFQEITNKVTYLESHFGWDAVQEMVPQIGEEPEEHVGPALIAQRLGIREELGPEIARAITARVPDTVGIPGVRAGTLYPFPLNRVRPGMQQKLRDVTLHVDTIAARVLVRRGGEQLIADMRPLLRSSAAAATRESGVAVHAHASGGEVDPIRVERMIDVEIPPASAVVPLRNAAGEDRGQLIVRSISFRIPPGTAQTPAMQMLDAQVLLFHP